jgi:hypothetical protein
MGRQRKIKGGDRIDERPGKLWGVVPIYFAGAEGGPPVFLFAVNGLQRPSA